MSMAKALGVTGLLLLQGAARGFECGFGCGVSEVFLLTGVPSGAVFTYSPSLLQAPEQQQMLSVDQAMCWLGQYSRGAAAVCLLFAGRSTVHTESQGVYCKHQN